VRPIYAPALVAFVGGGRAGISVWFPLGPRDPYFPWYHHSDNYLRQVNVTNVSVRNVTVINNYINVRNVTNVRYEYQRVAPTAVSTDAFRSARRVDREMVHLRPDEVGRGRVIPHPEVTPDVRAIHAGAPEAHPTVMRTRPQFEERKDAGGNRPGMPATGNKPGNSDTGFNRGRDNKPAVTGQPPARTDEGNRDFGRGRVPDTGNRPTVTTPPPATAQPPVRRDEGNRGRGEDFSTRPVQQPRVVTNNPPPPQNPKFEQRQPAMQEHPGRPLEPKQMDNVRQGQPAGASHDREYTPHQTTARPNPPPPPPAAPKDNRKDDKQDKDRRR
jgi:hypothetical protein